MVNVPEVTLRTVLELLFIYLCPRAIVVAMVVCVPVGPVGVKSLSAPLSLNHLCPTRDGYR